MKNHIIISLLFISIGLSQKEYNSNDLIEMDNGLYTVKFSDEPITGKVYSYFGKIKSLKKVYVGNLLNGKEEGKWVNYYSDTGKKRYEFNYKDGEEDGLWIYWYENGQKQYEGSNKDGEQDGLWTYWYDNGQKKWEIIYRDGDLVNFIGEWNEDGSVKE